MTGSNTISRADALSIGAASERSGVNIETIRYYERIGLVAPPRRGSGRQRVYDRNQIRQLIFIRRGRELGFSLDEIRVLIGLNDTGGRSCAEVRSITEQHAAAIRGKIDDLERIEQVLLRMAAKCHGAVAPTCPILETLSSTAARSEV